VSLSAPSQYASSSGSRSSRSKASDSAIRAPLPVYETVHAGDTVSDVPVGFYALMLVLQSADVLLKTLRPTQQTLKPPPVDGTYILVKSLGHGGFAEVFHVTDAAGTPFAWKTVRDIKDREQLECEARALRSFGNECHYIIHLEKDILDPDLRALLLTPVGMPVVTLTQDDALICIENIAEALHFAHAKRFAHGDVRYKNIVRVDDRFILIDWGMAAEFSHAGAAAAAAAASDFRQLGWVIVGLTSTDSPVPWFAARTNDELKREMQQNFLAAWKAAHSTSSDLDLMSAVLALLDGRAPVRRGLRDAGASVEELAAHLAAISTACT
jgi:serine/threonine protein kinase